MGYLVRRCEHSCEGEGHHFLAFFFVVWFCCWCWPKRACQRFREYPERVR